jgi:hypothetical protein
MKWSALLVFLSALFIISCRKESFIESGDARIFITSDSLKYDTVFVTTGSTYRSFRIINENDQRLRLSSVRLAGGNASSFKMNVDGTPGAEFSNLEIEANDSLYVFVQVNVDPTADNLPFIIRDSISIEYNGNRRWVQLEAWGRNAHFLRDKLVSADETWNNDLPYVILGSLRIAANRTLSINQGCRIYMHADAPIIVDGSLQVNGAADTALRVYFQGDRLDAPFRDFPASWPGIFFQPGSKDNILQYAVIKNAYQAIGLTDPSPNLNPKLVLNECVIDNAYDAGIVALNSSIRARNCLVSNCGQNLLLVKGGQYDFEHCTIASIGNRYISHQNPVLVLSNYVVVNNNPVTADLAANFRNNIFWGANGLVDDEVVVARNGNGPFTVTFNNNLWKQQAIPQHITGSQNINNQDPRFDSVAVFDHFFDFRLKPGSPAIDKGLPGPVSVDLDGRPRPVGLPDLGCFERQ